MEEQELQKVKDIVVRGIRTALPGESEKFKVDIFSPICEGLNYEFEGIRYKVGDRFNCSGNNKHEYVISSIGRVRDNKVALINIHIGKMWTTVPFEVGDIYSITSHEFKRICNHCIFHIIKTIDPSSL